MAENNGTAILDNETDVLDVTSEAPAKGKTKKAVADKPAARAITITPPNFETVEFLISGTAPYMQARFSEKARNQMKAKQMAGSTAKRGQREARDFEADYLAAMHTTKEGRYGIPAAAFRNAMIDACRMVGYPMTKAKCSIFILADDYDSGDGQPLVYLTGEPEPTEMTVRNETGVADIRVRPTWNEWTANLRVQFDADQFTREEVANLLHRAGVQIGVGEGRPFSKKSNGLGLGTFQIG